MENEAPVPMNELIALVRGAFRDAMEVAGADAAARASLARALEFQAQALDRAHRTALDFAVNRCETLQAENREMRIALQLERVLSDAPPPLTRKPRRGKRRK